MRGEGDVLHAQHRIVVRGRFLLKHVERGMRDPAFLQGLDQCLLVDGCTAAVGGASEQGRSMGSDVIVVTRLRVPKSEGE